jgi:DNA-binding XRE family transcriptional regulator
MRLDLGLSQEGLAHRLGVCRNTLIAAEGARKVTLETAALLAAFYGTSVRDLRIRGSLDEE